MLPLAGVTSATADADNETIPLVRKSGTTASNESGYPGPRLRSGTDEPARGRTSPALVTARKAEHRVLLEALRRIPIELQILLELDHIQELTAGELADVCGVTEVALRGRLHRAKERLRAEVQRTLAPSDTWAAR